MNDLKKAVAKKSSPSCIRHLPEAPTGSLVFNQAELNEHGIRLTKHDGGFAIDFARTGPPAFTRTIVEMEELGFTGSEIHDVLELLHEKTLYSRMRQACFVKKYEPRG